MNKNLIEKIIGGKKLGNLTPNSTLSNLFLLTEHPAKIIIYNNLPNDNILNHLVGIDFDGNLVGRRSDIKTEIILSANKYFDGIEMQSICIQAKDQKQLWWQHISYLLIKYNGTEYQVGTKQFSDSVVEFEPGLSCKFSKVEQINCNTFISGVGTHNDGIICLQVIEFKDNNTEQIDNLVYGKGICTLIEANIDNRISKNQLLKENVDIIFPNHKFINNILDIEKFILDYNLIGLEDPDVLQLFMLIFSRQMRWTASREALSIYHPLITKLIDKVIEEKNHKIIHSVYRIDRLINHLIYSHDTFESKPTVFHKFNDLMIKIKHLWNPLVKTMEKCQDIQKSQISYNCYHLANLSNNSKNKFYAVITFICQMALMVLLGISFADKSIKQIFPLIEGRVIIPLIFIFTIMISFKQISNTIDYRRIFYLGNIYDIFDFISNILTSITIIFFNFFILSFNDKVLDIVLNSVASLFILELDDSAVFDTSDTIDNMIRNRLLEELNNNIRLIPNLYFNSLAGKSWKVVNGVFKLDSENYNLDIDSLSIIKKDKTNIDV